NSVWIGILIEFEADERILRAEYINPVNGFDVIQDTLQKQLSKVYSFAVLRSRNILTHHDHRGSATLTVKNLLQAVKDEQYPDFINPTPLQSHNSRVTGSGKSTTIQFLAGATMKEVRVQISPGKYLEHVTAVGSFKNPELNNVTSSSLQKSETRFIAPVTIQLEDVLGAHESGEMILCDAPGFGDTAGPEVDIANSIESFIQEAYKESIRFVSEQVSGYGTDIMKNFNRALASEDELQEKDILDYQTSINYLEEAQVLKEHLESYLISPAALVTNIVAELKQINDKLNQDDLNNPLVTIYLDNLCMLKSSFMQLEENYSNSCRKFEKHFDELLQTVHELIRKNDFKQVAELPLNILQCLQALKNHLPSRAHESYSGIVKYLLQYLCNLSEKVEPFLAKVRLNNDEVELVKNSMEILRSAKENSALQERVSKYIEMLKKKTCVADEHDTNQTFGNNTKDLNEIYNEFITKAVRHFDEISLRIKEIFDTNGDNALEYIKTLVSDMDALRTIPELETKTAGTYYHTIENIRGYMQHLLGEVEKLVIAIDQQSGITNYRYLARSLSRLKNAEWINQVSPGAYDNLMRRITEELMQYACQLEDSLMKINFSLKCPENVSIAKEIVEKIESTRDLERSVPELEKYRSNIRQRFLRCTQDAFNRIQKTFNLQDKDVYQIKQHLKELQEIQQECSNLHPACIFLQKQGYARINMLNSDIDELKAKNKQEIEVLTAAQRDMESELQNLNLIVQKSTNLSSSSTDEDVFGIFSDMIGLDSQKRRSQTETYLRSSEYSSIESVYEKFSNVRKKHRQISQRIEDQRAELRISLGRLESIKKEHDLLIDVGHSSSKEVSFLQEKGFDSYELLSKNIQEKERIFNERGQNQQSYHFSGRLDASTANSALVYISQCEKVGHDRVRENATDANENLRKYIKEYGIFLKQEINMKFNYMRTIDDERDPFLYSQDLEMRLQELSSSSKFAHVFECINAAETVEDLQQKFLEFHRILSSKMEEYKNASKIKELRDQVIIAQALACVDRFCANILAGNGFADLYKQYQREIHKECRIAYKTVLDYISKGDYPNVDMALSDIQDKPLNPRDKAQIQNDLHCSLNKLMNDTKSIANWLSGKVERENNRNQITEIKENIEKIRIACNKHMIMKLLDEDTQTSLKKFDNEINETLSRIILKGLNSIEAFMDADSFSEA
ncbi:unnamed protein product, partial [Rotaria sp. Silwood2]